MSAQQALALPSPAASNTVVINARCSLRIEADQRVIVVAGLPVHHYRAEDVVAVADAMVFLVEFGLCPADGCSAGIYPIGAHRTALPRALHAAQALCEMLDQTATIFPGSREHAFRLEIIIG